MPKIEKAPSPEKRCDFTWEETNSKGEKVTHQCDGKRLAKGKCWTHYMQLHRGRPLTPVREKENLVLLAGNVRVPEEVEAYLQQRVKTGKAKSIYEATRQAIERGVESWEKSDKIKAAKGS